MYGLDNNVKAGTCTAHTFAKFPTLFMQMDIGWIAIEQIDFRDMHNARAKDTSYWMDGWIRWIELILHLRMYMGTMNGRERASRAYGNAIIEKPWSYFGHIGVRCHRMNIDRSPLPVTMISIQHLWKEVCSFAWIKRCVDHWLSFVGEGIIQKKGTYRKGFCQQFSLCINQFRFPKRVHRQLQYLLATHFHAAPSSPLLFQRFWIQFKQQQKKNWTSFPINF